MIVSDDGLAQGLCQKCDLHCVIDRGLINLRIYRVAPLPLTAIRAGEESGNTNGIALPAPSAPVRVSARGASGDGAVLARVTLLSTEAQALLNALLSPNTRRAYQRHVQTFDRGRSTDQAVTDALIAGYLTCGHEKGLAPVTQSIPPGNHVGEDGDEIVAPASLHIPEMTDLLGVDPAVYCQINAALASSKKHVMLYGSKGTRKITLARHIATLPHCSPTNSGHC